LEVVYAWSGHSAMKLSLRSVFPWGESQDSKLDLTAAIDSIRIELEVLKTYMERYHPGFAESYPKFREEAIQAIDPEWMGARPGKKIGPNQNWVEGLNRRLGRDEDAK
jgi:hypothetical protein